VKSPSVAWMRVLKAFGEPHGRRVPLGITPETTGATGPALGGRACPLAASHAVSVSG